MSRAVARARTVGVISSVLATQKASESPRHLAQKAADCEWPCEDRCKVCTRDDVWDACDAFATFDPACSGDIRREEFFSLHRGRIVLRQLRIVDRAGLVDRFRRSTQPVSLQEFVRRLWQGASEEDLQMIDKWARLRMARISTLAPGFLSAGEQHRWRAFKWFAPLDCDSFPAVYLLHAGVMTNAELRAVFDDVDDIKQCRVDFDAFQEKVRTHLNGGPLYTPLRFVNFRKGWCDEEGKLVLENIFEHSPNSDTNEELVERSAARARTTGFTFNFLE